MTRPSASEPHQRKTESYLTTARRARLLSYNSLGPIPSQPQCQPWEASNVSPNARILLSSAYQLGGIYCPQHHWDSFARSPSEHSEARETVKSSGVVFDG